MTEAEVPISPEKQPQKSPSGRSPRWSVATKTVVGLTFVAIVALLVIRFQDLMAPLIFVFLLSFLLFPLIRMFSKVTRLPWGVSTTIVFVTIIGLLVGTSTVLGIVIVQQLASLIGLLQTFFISLPDLIETWLNSIPESINILAFTIPIPTLAQVDLPALAQQLLSFVQPALGQAGTFVSGLATGTATTLAWSVFVLTVTFFVLVEMGGAPSPRSLLADFELPGYQEDIQRLFSRLGEIWNSFIRGQVLLYIVAALIYYVVLTTLGVRFAIGLSLLAGFARFIPYIGPWIIWGTVSVVTFFQASHPFGLDVFWHTAIVLVSVSLVDLFFDNVVTPRLFGSVLGIHPAAVLVAVIMLASIVGFIGLLIAAPVLATVQLIGTYAIRKMLDQDPWPPPKGPYEKGLLSMTWPEFINSVGHQYVKLVRRFQRRSNKVAQAQPENQPPENQSEVEKEQ